MDWVVGPGTGFVTLAVALVALGSATAVGIRRSRAGDRKAAQAAFGAFFSSLGSLAETSLKGVEVVNAAATLFGAVQGRGANARRAETRFRKVLFDLSTRERKNAKRDGREAVENFDDALNEASDAVLPLAEVARLNRVEKVTEAFLSAARERIGDERAYRRAEPFLREVYPTLFAQEEFRVLLDPERNRAVADAQLEAADRSRASAQNEHRLAEAKVPLRSEKHRQDSAGGDKSSIDSLYFTRRRDPLVGDRRRELIESLCDSFLNFETGTGTSQFLWTLIHGDAGTGKSRFAVELLREAERRLGDVPPPRFWGFVAQDRKSPLTPDDIAEWRIDEPAVVVLDYAGTNDDLDRIVIAFWEKVRELSFPIRLILLDRTTSGGGLSKLRDAPDPDGPLNTCLFEFDASEYGEEFGIRLEPLTRGDAVKIMKARIEAQRPVSSRETDDWLSSCLDEVTPGERRPLFAAMIGEALAREEPPSGSGRQEVPDPLKKRDQILTYLINRDRKWNWIMEEGDEDSLDIHENLLALSTFCRGVDWSVLRQHGGPDQPLQIPAPSAFNRKQYQRMAREAPPASEGNVALGFLEPDLIGEWFVLKRLDPSENSHPTDRDAFIRLGWQFGQERTAQFIRRAHQNFPIEVAALGYMLPSSEMHFVQVIRLLRDLLADLRFVLGHIARDTVVSEVAPECWAIGRRAEDIFERLRSHVDGSAELSDAMRIDIADATDHALYIQGWLHSPSLRRRKDDRFSAVGEDSSESPVRSPSRVSVRLNQAFRKESTTAAQSAVGEFSTTSGGVDSGSTVYADGARLSISEEERQVLLEWEESERSRLSRVYGLKPEGGKTVADVAARLLGDASRFMRSLATENPPLASQMKQNADVFEAVATHLKEDPMGRVDEVPVSVLAAKLLDDSAQLFLQIAEQNEAIREEMTQNAEVFKRVAKMVRDDPIKRFDENDDDDDDE